MTFCPFATLELVAPHSSTSLIGHSLGCIEHVNAGDGDPYSTFALGLADSHWQIMKSGDLIQYVDSDLDSWAQIDGNNSYHSCETEGYPTETLTAAQCAMFARLYAWGHQTYGWPLLIAQTVGEPGLGWHGMGGDNWGGHFGCPGDLRKAQRRGILAAAAALLPGAVAALTTDIEGTDMLQINAHGRSHLFNVQPDGKLVWRAHQDNGKWNTAVLTTGAHPAATVAAWSAGAVPAKVGATPDTYLQVAVELANGKVWHGWMAPGAPWQTQSFAAA